MTENWKPVVGYEGLYEVSDFGDVYSIRSQRNLVGDTDKRERRGHRRVTLVGEKIKTYLVSRLVLLHFVGDPPEGKPHACHGPKGASDNSLSNLYWASRKQNMADKYRDGTEQTGERNGACKLTVAKVKCIRLLKRSGIKAKVIAAEFGVCHRQVYKICSREKWKHVV